MGQGHSTLGVPPNSPVINTKKSRLSMKSKTPASPLKDFIRQEDIKELCVFWKMNITSLQESSEEKVRDKYGDLCMLVYSNLFSKYPQLRKRFVFRDMRHQGSKLLGMFEWLIWSLTFTKPNPGKIYKRLKKLGQFHAKMNVTETDYMCMMEALHGALEETFPNKYNLRLHFLVDTTFSAVAHVMTKADLSAKRPIVDEIVEFLVSYHACLESSKGLMYLEQFMKSQYCEELLYFYFMYGEYQTKLETNDRSRIGRAMFNRFIQHNAPDEINISCDTKKAILEHLKKTNGLFTETLFDGAAREVYNLIRRSVWKRFQSTMIEIAGCAEEFKKAYKLRRRRATLGEGSMTFSNTQTNTVNTMTTTGTATRDQSASPCLPAEHPELGPSFSSRDSQAFHKNSMDGSTPRQGPSMTPRLSLQDLLSASNALPVWTPTSNGLYGDAFTTIT